MSTPFLASVAVESVLLRVLVQLAVIILAARLFAIVFRWLGQPAVVGEIAAGLALGPSLFGKLSPQASAAIFDPGVRPILNIISQLGLIFLLFLVGLEFDFRHLRLRGRASIAISAMGVILPFALGWLLAQWMHPYLELAVDQRGFALFMGTAMSITAIPVLARIMLELNITRTRIGAITITAAAVDDATGWILLATVSAMVQASFDPWESLRMVALTVVFAVLMLRVGRPILKRWIRAALRQGRGELSLNSLAILLVVVFLAAIATNLIGIFAVFGAFVVGAILSDEHEFREAVGRHLRDFVTAFFLPIFFTYTGLNTDIGTLETRAMWLFAAAVSLIAVLGKFGGCSLAAWFGGFRPREAACIGALMNTRGLMELIVINVGYELRVIPPSVYCMLVLMALLTTVMTTPALLRFMPGTELEPHVAASSFAARGRRLPGATPPGSGAKT